MTKILLNAFFIFACLPSQAFASQSDRFTGALGLTYASEYVTDGFKIGNSSPVMQMSVKLDIPKTDFSLMYWSSLRAVRAEDQYDEHDFLLMYNRDFFSGETYAFNFHTFLDYWFYPNTPPLRDGFGNEISNVQKHGGKVSSGVSMTNLIPLAGSYLVPAYNVYYWLYWAEDRADQYLGGARHELSLSYNHGLPKIASWIKSQYMGVFASLSYNDGALGVRPGWSHSIGTLYAGIAAFSSQFIVSANKQLSYQRTVNENNDFWMTVSLVKEF